MKHALAKGLLFILSIVAFAPAQAMRSDERGFKDYRCIGRVLENGESRLLFDLAVPLRHGQYGEFMGQRITIDTVGRVSSEIDDQRDKKLSPLGPLPEGVNYVVYAQPGPDFNKDSFVPKITTRRAQAGSYPRLIKESVGDTDAYVETSADNTRVECIRVPAPVTAAARR